MADPNPSDWDPMKMQSQSFMNSMSFRINDPGSIFAGCSMSDLKEEDFPCQFQREPGKLCFKGRSCKKKHGKYTPKMLRGEFQLSKS